MNDNTPTPTQAASVVVVNADALVRITRQALVGTTNNKTLLAWLGIRYRVVGDTLIAEATDRFVAVKSWTETSTASPDFRIALERQEVDQLLAIAKAADKLANITLTVEGGNLTVESANGMTATLREGSYQFPKIENIWKADEQARQITRPEGVTVNPRYLGHIERLDKLNPRDDRFTTAVYDHQERANAGLVFRVGPKCAMLLLVKRPVADDPINTTPIPN